MDYSFVGNRITELLASENMSEYQLSASLGRCNSYIQKITSMKSLPSMKAFFSICDCFHITPAEFFSQTSPSVRKASSELMEAAEGLNEEDIALLITIAQRLKGSKPAEHKRGRD